MMDHLFSDIDGAFEPFYSEKICFVLKDGSKQIIRACFFQDGDGEPLSEAFESSRKDAQILCESKDWRFLKALSRGDKAVREDFGTSWTVSSV